MIISQQKIIAHLVGEIEQLKTEMERLKVSRELDSKTSSKPPSTDLLKKLEKAPANTEEQKSLTKSKVRRATRTSRFNTKRI